ncbi:MAG: RNB domain-containing ribonuclease [Defluviitaleaceae bacterium]|nr:RNB domain-containing ribonuclease [Defluviitaleaceae bacterium]
MGNARGFGFVIAQEDRGGDVFIPPHFTFGALNGDLVRYVLDDASKWRDSGQPEGRVLEVLQREPMVGTYFVDAGQGYVRPVDARMPCDFAVSAKTVKKFGLVDGLRVAFSVDMALRPDLELANAYVIKVLGHVNDPGVDVLSLVYEAGVPYEFPENATAEAAALPDDVNPASQKGRRDLRSQLIFTIDGDDTKDIDDGISFEVKPDGYRLGVHIADVSHYVAAGGALDGEAFARGTSIYLADRVIPMLPHKLSSGVCSLLPGVDRLSLSCVMEIDQRGNVLEYEIFESVICSKKRLTYDQVQAELAPDGEHTRENAGGVFVYDSQPVAGDTAKTNPIGRKMRPTGFEPDWPTLFHQMNGLREILYNKRLANGALDFDLSETKIRVDEAGRPISVEPHKRNQATGIIEEFMILCNETIATHLLGHGLPGVFRTHEAPSAAKLAALQPMAKGFGISIPKKAEKPMALQRLLSATANSPAAAVVAQGVLRSLPQAHYTPDSPGHYGLASAAYCHFTSPIRRYADLTLHRILKAWLGRKTTPVTENLPAICAQCSTTERIAEALEREVTQLKKVQFMEGQEGQTYNATVSGVTPRGIFVMLKNTIEGMIPATNLTKYDFKFDKEKNIYIRRSKKKSRTKNEALYPGATVKVRLAHVSQEEMKLTFVLGL